jgi:hypothetical protein
MPGGAGSLVDGVRSSAVLLEPQAVGGGVPSRIAEQRQRLIERVAVPDRVIHGRDYWRSLRTVNVTAVLIWPCI